MSKNYICPVCLLEGRVTEIDEIKITGDNPYYPDLSDIEYLCPVHGRQVIVGEVQSLEFNYLLTVSLESVKWVMALAGRMLWKKVKDILTL